MKLTEIEFWENYWKNYTLPCIVDTKNSFDRCLSRSLKKHIKNFGGDVLEVGCAPGKWLAFMTSEFSMNASGIEYSEAGMTKTLENFNLLNLKPSKIYVGDFNLISPDCKYDIVMSFGFIEHFDNPEEIINLHLEWLKPGGILVLGLPNFTGINKLIQYFLDQSILKKHNLNIMNINYFNKLAVKLNLDVLYLNFIGSFEPSLFISKYKYGNLLQFFLKVFIRFALYLRKITLLDYINHKLFSSYILGIYRKKY